MKSYPYETMEGYTVWVLEDAFNKIKNQKLSIVGIVSKVDFPNCLHNTKGPAVTQKGREGGTYFINGKSMDPSISEHKKVIESIQNGTYVESNVKTESFMGAKKTAKFNNLKKQFLELKKEVDKNENN